MPIIELPMSILTAPTRFDLLPIETAMLHPGEDDSPVRDHISRSALSSEIPAMVGSGQMDLSRLEPEIGAKILEELLNADPLGNIQERAKRPYVEGIAVASLVISLLSKRPGSANTMAEAKTIGLRVLNDAGDRNVDNETMEKVWRRYRPVAHWWAAYYHRSIKGSNSSFPCQASEITDLIAHADFFLRVGAEHKLSGGKKPRLLHLDAAWHPADELIAALPIRYDRTAT